MKQRRQQVILRLLEAHHIERHEQLQQLLVDEGIVVNQATLSRDLRSLGVVKGASGDGNAHYRLAHSAPDNSLALANLQAFLRDIVVSGNMLVIKTKTGCAQPVGLALDQLALPSILGTIAGDDTVFAVVEAHHDSHEVAQSIWSTLTP
jgi:transcriptional regulator of arginine metabolism